MQKVLDDVRLKLADLECLQMKLDELNVKAVGLEVEVLELKLKVAKAKEVGIAEFKESDTYKLTLNTVTVQFPTKERLKMK